MTERLTDEQVTEALRQARAADVTEGICYAGFARESDACQCNEHSRRRIARALLQVSADLSAAKEVAEDEIRPALNSCRDVLELGRFAPAVDPIRWVREVEACLARALRSLLPEEER